MRVVAAAATLHISTSACRADAQPSGQTPADVMRAVDTYVKHIYLVYFGIRACDELSKELHDPAYAATVSLAEARVAMHGIEGAAKSVGVQTDVIWASVAPNAIVTAEALKRISKRLSVCQRIGGIFRSDEANLQNLLGGLGSRQTLIPKDF